MFLHVSEGMSCCATCPTFLFPITATSHFPFQTAVIYVRSILLNYSAFLNPGFNAEASIS